MKRIHVTLTVAAFVLGASALGFCDDEPAAESATVEEATVEEESEATTDAEDASADDADESSDEEKSAADESEDEGEESEAKDEHPFAAARDEGEAPKEVLPPGGGPPKPPEAAKPDGDGEQKPEDGSPGQPPGENGEKKDDKKGGDKDKKDDATGIVTRPNEPEEAPDAAELDLRPDADGRVRLQFHGQPWLGVLQWLAEISEMSLDWQEIPGGYLNLNTVDSYTVDETRDLINRHLLARGFTLLRNGEILSVVKLDTLNPGMVPRVAPEDLASRDAHEFVKVSFPLDWLMADEAVEELKPMLGRHGKLTPLTQTNRVEAIDAVINLREIHAMLLAEQSSEGQGRLVREFELKHTRAEDIRVQVLALLGVEERKAPTTPEQMQMEQQRMQMQMQQAQQQQQGKGGPPKKEAPVQIVADSRRNKILVNAPPDKMEVIEQAVKMLDVDNGPGGSLLSEMTRMHIYRLAAVDPKPLVQTLNELGGLDPKTRLQIDDKNQAIIAYATLADHATINALIEKLDGSGRRFEVRPLREHDADYLAGTIDFLMGGQEKEDKSSSSSYGYFYSPFGSSRNKETNSKDKFRVDADVEHNRLLLWANDIELEEVDSLLVKLGEIPPDTGDLRTMRVLSAMPEHDARELIEAVRQAWPGVAPNELILPPTPIEQTPESDDAPPEGQGEAGAASVDARVPSPTTRLVSLFSQADESTTAPRANAPSTLPPVRLRQEVDGSLVIECEDPKALDKLEELIGRLAPRPVDYKIYRLKYAWPYGLKLTLEELFGEKEKDDDRRMPYWYYWDMPSNSDDDARSRLSKRRPIKFISDSDTNTLLVQNATPEQLAKIEALIQFYDQPEPTDSQSIRRTEIVRLRHSKAEVIVDAVKEVYRDLLSSNDKSLAGNQENRQERVYFYDYVGGEDGDGETMKPKFKGLLSIGVDKLSNTLVISAPGFLIDDVLSIINELDEAARPRVDCIRVVPLKNGVSAAGLKQVLQDVLQKKNASTPEADKPKPDVPGPGRPEG